LRRRRAGRALQRGLAGRHAGGFGCVRPGRACGPDALPGRSPAAVRLRVRHDRDEYRVEARAPETIAYWEGERAFLLRAAWGARPRELYVPAENLWDQVVPDWLKGRRPVVVDRLAARSKHRIVDTEDGYAAGVGELRPIR